ncbi:MAG: ABC transporter substrate-binding protein [Candidatus Rokuibacteriota bacterium]
MVKQARSTITRKMILARVALVFPLIVVILTAPLACEAQPAVKVHRVGFLATGAKPSTPLPSLEAFENGLRELGYVERQNLVIEWRFAGGAFARLPDLAADLVRSSVDVIVVAGPGPIQAAKAATTTIPIVMLAGSSDPVAEGLVASLARPGGNITGLTYAVSPERFGKQLELLKEAVGRLSRVVVLWDLDMDFFRRQWATPLGEAAQRLGLQLQGPVQVREPGQLDTAFATMIAQKAEAIFVVMGGPAYQHRARVAELAIRNRLPTVAAFKEFPQAGGFMSYGPDLPDIYRRGATYVDRILRGAKPADLPVEQPAKFELVVNLNTAKALGLTIPSSILARADYLIQ